jgi:hypothetical protein
MGVGLIWAIVGGFVVIAVIASFFTGEAKTRRALRNAPRVTIAEFPEGTPARIVGRVEEGEQLTAPLSGRPCVFYDAIVQQYRSSGRSGSWHTVIRESRGIPFALDDGTGRALVDPTAARLAVEKDSTTRSGTFDDATPTEEAFLARHGLRSQGMIFNKRLRYREGALEIGETIAVCGIAVREPDPDAASRATGYRDALPTRLRLTSSPKLALLISDYADTKR